MCSALGRLDAAEATQLAYQQLNNTTPTLDKMLRAVVRPASLVPRAALTRAASSSVPKVQFDPSDKAPKEAAPGQSPNVPSTWSQNQQPKDAAFNNPRFEQVYVPTQPDSLSAMGLVNEQPIVKVQGRRAVCNGGKSTLKEDRNRSRARHERDDGDARRGLKREGGSAGRRARVRSFPGMSGGWGRRRSHPPSVLRS